MHVQSRKALQTFSGFSIHEVNLNNVQQQTRSTTRPEAVVTCTFPLYNTRLCLFFNLVAPFISARAGSGVSSCQAAGMPVTGLVEFTAGITTVLRGLDLYMEWFLGPPKTDYMATGGHGYRAV